MRRSHYSDLTERTIPARIVIGVTGHRKLENQPALTNAVRSAILCIYQMLLSMTGTATELCILSPLAEGADRLVVEEVLRIPRSTLEVVLPLEKEDYTQDFQTSQSKEEFEKLLTQASSIRTLPTKANRTEAYRRVGRYVVDHCDVLIALWNGITDAGRGGTQEIVGYARHVKCPLVWVHTDMPVRITIENDGR